MEWNGMIVSCSTRVAVWSSICQKGRIRVEAGSHRKRTVAVPDMTGRLFMTVWHSQRATDGTNPLLLHRHEEYTLNKPIWQYMHLREREFARQADKSSTALFNQTDSGPGTIPLKDLHWLDVSKSHFYAAGLLKCRLTLVRNLSVAEASRSSGKVWASHN